MSMQLPEKRSKQASKQWGYSVPFLHFLGVSVAGARACGGYAARFRTGNPASPASGRGSLVTLFVDDVAFASLKGSEI